MQQIKKITLFPTRKMQSQAPDAIGSAHFDNTARQISIHLFNLPEPTQVLGDIAESATYKGWLYHPDTGELLPLGSLSPGGDHLYFLYDTPFPCKDGFREVVITAGSHEDLRVTQSDILLIGYLTQEKAQAMTPFEPFDPPLAQHKWWKLQPDPAGNQALMHGPTPPGVIYSHPTGLPCDHCPRRQYSTPLPASIRPDGFDLPRLVGMITDENGKLQYLIHGIPGRLLRSDQPDQGRTGYLYWHPYYGIEERIGAIGYWLCYIDPKTHQFTTPLGVTIPPG